MKQIYLKQAVFLLAWFELGQYPRIRCTCTHNNEKQTSSFHYLKFHDWLQPIVRRNSLPKRHKTVACLIQGGRGWGGAKLPSVLALWDGGKCVKCRGLVMASTEKVRLVQGQDGMVGPGMCGVQRVLVKTNTEKVRTNMERVREVQEDWTKALVAESLTNRTCSHAYILILIRFFVQWSVFVCWMISTFSAKQRLHLLVVFWYSVAFRCMLHWML